MQQLDLVRVAWWNLQQLGLVQPFVNAEATVQSLVAVQAQDYGSASQAIALRTVDRKPLEPLLLPGGPLVRLWTVRGTMHIVTTAEAPYHQAATADEWSERWGRYLQNHAAEPLTLIRQQVYPQIREVLGCNPLTHAQIAERAHLPDRYAKQLPHLLKDLCYLGGCVRGPQTGGKALYFAPWFGLLPPDSAWDAKRFLLRRFISRYGPVTVADMVYCSGFRVPTVRQILKEVQRELAVVRLQDQPEEAYLLAEQLPQLLDLRLPDPGMVQHYLPAFDVLLLGYKDKRRFIDEANVPQVFLSAARVSPIVLRDRRVIGTWAGDPPAVRLFS